MRPGGASPFLLIKDHKDGTHDQDDGGYGVRTQRWLLERAGLILALISTTSVVFLSDSASANPIVRKPFDTTFKLDDPVSGIAWLFFINLLVNLACYTGMLLAIAKKLLDWGSLLQTSGIRFLGALVCAVVAITAVGALVDFYLVAQPRYVEDLHGTYRVLAFDPITWALALILIMESVMLTSMLILKMGTGPSIIAAGGMGVVNLAFWLLTGLFGQDAVFITLIFGIMLSPVLVSLLIRWYNEGIRKSGVSSTV